MEPLTPEFHGVLQLLRIEHPPLGVANTPSIRQRGHTASPVTSQQAIGAADADSVFGGQLREAAALLQMLDHQPEAPTMYQAGIGVDAHGGVRPGLLGNTSTRRGLTPPCQLNNLLRQNS